MKKVAFLLVMVIITLLFASCNDNITAPPTTEDITEGIGTTEKEDNEYRLYDGYCSHTLKLEQLDANILPVEEVIEIENTDMPKQKNINVGGIEYQCEYSGSYYTNVYDYNFHRYIDPDEVTIDLYDDGGVRMFSKRSFIKFGDIGEKTVDELRVLVENELKNKFPELIDFQKYDVFNCSESVSYGNSEEFKSYTFTWCVSKNEFETQERIRTYLGSSGEIGTVYFIHSDDSIDACDFQLSKDQKETVINTVLENKLTTDLTEYMDYYEIKTEEVVSYEGIPSMYIVANARFKVEHKDVTHQYWYVPVEIILPLDDFVITEN